jgi:drug/metabolite transporter (DMT)-like permease
MTKKSYRYTGILLAFFGAIFFSGKAIIIKYLYNHYDVETLPLLSLRMIFSVPFYIAVLWFSRNSNAEPTTKSDRYKIFGLGISGYYLASFFDFKGLEYITATMERLVLFVYPTLVLILSAILLGKKISKFQLVAVIMTYLGILTAFLPDFETNDQKNMLVGIGLIFLSGLCYAIYLMGTGQMVKKFGTLKLSSLALIISTIAVIIHYYLVDGRSLVRYPEPIYFWSIIMAIFCTVLPTFMVAEGIKRIGSSNASIIGTIGPMSTILMATQILGEPFAWYHGVGTVIILAGITYLSLSKGD